jgi:hypothetical protein
MTEASFNIVVSCRPSSGWPAFLYGGDKHMGIWKWDVDSEVIACNANMARDRHMFRVPTEGHQAKERLHSGERVSDFNFAEDGYNIILAGHLVNNQNT